MTANKESKCRTLTVDVGGSRDFNASGSITIFAAFHFSSRKFLMHCNFYIVVAGHILKTDIGFTMALLKVIAIENTSGYIGQHVFDIVNG